MTAEFIAGPYRVCVTAVTVLVGESEARKLKCREMRRSRRLGIAAFTSAGAGATRGATLVLVIECASRSGRNAEVRSKCWCWLVELDPGMLMTHRINSRDKNSIIDRSMRFFGTGSACSMAYYALKSRGLANSKNK